MSVSTALCARVCLDTVRLSCKSLRTACSVPVFVCTALYTMVPFGSANFHCSIVSLSDHMKSVGCLSRLAVKPTLFALRYRVLAFGDWLDIFSILKLQPYCTVCCVTYTAIELIPERKHSTTSTIPPATILQRGT